MNLPPPSSASATPFRSGNDSTDTTTLLDYAYYVIESWEASGEHINLKKAWLERARELGAEPSR